MNEVIIRLLTDAEDMPWDLFLLADPSRRMVEEYISKSNIYLAEKDGSVVGEYILFPVNDEVVELKNIAVAPHLHQKGIGKMLVLHAIEEAKGLGYREITVGTGNSSLNQLALYQKCGFRITGVETDFFTKNYEEEIVENGIKCIDMIRLSLEL